MSNSEPSCHPARLPLEELLREVRIDVTRGPGPGGQHRNKTDTSIRAVHEPTGLQAIAGERRSKEINRKRALFRLRVRLALSHRERPWADGSGEAYEPSALWRARLRGTRFVVSPNHADFPAILAEALDVLAATDDDLPRAARLLGTTSSQLVKLLGSESEALRSLNQRLEPRGLGPWRASR